MKRIKRKRVDELIDVVVRNIEAINEDLLWPFMIEKAWLFGSCLNEQDDYGDVDIALKMTNVLCRMGTTQQFVDRTYAFCRLNGIRGLSAFDTYAWPERETLRRIRQRRPHISLHDDGILTEFKCPSRLIFPLPASPL